MTDDERPAPVDRIDLRDREPTAWQCKKCGDTCFRTYEAVKRHHKQSDHGGSEDAQPLYAHSGAEVDEREDDDRQLSHLDDVDESDLYQVDWRDVLAAAVLARPSSFRLDLRDDIDRGDMDREDTLWFWNEVFWEWRNATDEVAGALINWLRHDRGMCSDGCRFCRWNDEGDSSG